MSYGVVPVVFNSYGAAENVIDNCVNGYLVKPFDKKGYTKIVEYLIGDNLRLLKGLPNMKISCTINSIENANNDII